ncbi:hypothetical protein IJH66_01785 [Candidatus Saccharibacteria bacterium]|nr:hypothetical protein [Candidatus Saccharibacteria bacterium]
MDLKSAVIALQSAECFLNRYSPRLTEDCLKKMSLSKLELYEELTRIKSNDFHPAADYIENLCFSAIDLYNDENLPISIPQIYDTEALQGLFQRFSDVDSRLFNLAHSVFLASHEKFIAANQH